MRIVHAVSGLDENMDSAITERILSHLSKRYDFELIAPFGNYLFDRLSTTRVKFTPMPLSGTSTITLSDIIRLGRHFRHSLPDILHVHGYPSAGIAAVLSGVRRLISTPPDEEGKPSTVSTIYRAIALTVSHTASMTAGLICRGIPKERIVNMPYGIDNDIEGIFTPRDSRVILSEVSSAEDCPMLLSAVARALSQQQFDMVLVAERDLWHTVFRFSALLGIRLCIRVVEPKDAKKYYSMCRYFIHPSASNRKIPTPVLRAMSSGAAVILPSVPICHDIVRDGVCGLVYNASDSFALSECICRLNADADLTERLGRAAKERWQKHFSTEHMLSEYDRLYTSLLSLSDNCAHVNYSPGSGSCKR